MLPLCADISAQSDSIAAAYDIDEVSVNGVRTADDIRDIASRYSLSSSDFARLSVSDLTSALRRLPGITLRDYGGAGGMKTVSVRGMGSQHVGVALDGLLMPDVLSGQIDLQQFSLSEISSMTLSANGYSDIFQPARNFSKASVLSIETQPTEGTRIVFSTGSWGLWSPAASFSRRIKRTTISLQGGYSQANNNYKFLIKNGTDTHKERRQNSKTQQGYLGGSVLWQPTDSSSLRTTLRLSDNRRELPGIVHLYSNDNDEVLRDKSFLLQSQYHAVLSEKWQVKAAVRWDINEQKYHNGQPSGGIRSENYLCREYYATASVLFVPVRQLRLSYSADFWHDALRTTIADRPRPRRNSFLQSLSAKWTVKRLSLMGQVLNSNIGKERHVSPAVGASYRLLPRKELYIRLMYKDIFRMPTVTEQYYYHLGTQDLHPEKTRQANLGLSFRHVPTAGRGFGIETSANVYLNSVRDKIVAIPFNMFVYRYQNVEKTVGKGLDLMLDLDWFFSEKQSLSLVTNYSLQDIETRPTNKDYRPQQIAYTPLHSGSTTLTWQNPWVNIATTLLFASATWTTNEHDTGTRIAGYAEWGASVYRTLRIKRSEWEIRCTVQNLLDRNYCIVAHYPMPGRNFNFSLTYKFN